jgi:hypothetical protein
VGRGWRSGTRYSGCGRLLRLFFSFLLPSSLSLPLGTVGFCSSALSLSPSVLFSSSLGPGFCCIPRSPPRRFIRGRGIVQCQVPKFPFPLPIFSSFFLFFRIRPPWLGLPGGHGCGNFLPSFFLRGSWMHFAFVFRFSSPPRSL